MKTVRELSKGKRDMWSLDPRIIQVKPGWNPREENDQLEQHIDSLANLIFANGYDPTKPIAIYLEGDTYYVCDGHCRLRATLLAIKRGAPIVSIPVLTEARGVNEAGRVAAILTRNNGKRLEPLEQGRVYVRLQSFGWDDKQIAETAGVSITHVKQIFDLMAASPEAHALIKSGDVSATTVAAATKRHGAARAAKVIRRAVGNAKAGGKGKATLAAVERAANSGGADGESPEKTNRPLSEILGFFRDTLSEKNGSAAALQFLELFLRYRDGDLSPERFVKAIGEIL